MKMLKYGAICLSFIIIGFVVVIGGSYITYKKNIDTARFIRQSFDNIENNMFFDKDLNAEMLADHEKRAKELEIYKDLSFQITTYDGSVAEVKLTYSPRRVIGEEINLQKIRHDIDTFASKLEISFNDGKNVLDFDKVMEEEFDCILIILHTPYTNKLVADYEEALDKELQNRKMARMIAEEITKIKEGE